MLHCDFSWTKMMLEELLLTEILLLSQVFSLVLLMMQQEDVVKHLIPSPKHIPLSQRSNFPEMMGGKPHQNAPPWVKPNPPEAHFLQFILCEQASPPYRGAGGNRIAFHTKGLLQRNRGGRKRRLCTHSYSLTHAQESPSHMASSKAVYFFRAWLNYGE